MSCPNTEKCPLFPKLKLESTLQVLKAQYCDRDEQAYGKCARYQLFTAGQKPPPTLLPSGNHLEED